MDRLTPTGGEHVILGAPPAGADRQLLGRLTGTVLPEDLHGTGVDADSPRTARLGRALDPRAADNGHRPGDVDLACGEIDVTPAQVEQLTAARARVGRQVIEREQAMAPCLLQEHAELHG